MNRRHFLTHTGGLAGAALAGRSALALPTTTAAPKGKAENVVFIWLGGGMSQIDTFDPKHRGNSQASPKLAGSEYAAIDTAVAGVQFCEHLSRTAKLADRLTALRTVNHHLVDEHAFGTNFVHTGRLISGSITYPSIGSIIGHVRGAVNQDAPPYMLIGYPNVSRGSGFLGAKAGYVYLVDTDSGPAGFSRPEDVTPLRVDRRRQLLQPLVERVPDDSSISQYRTAQAEALRLAGPEFMRHFRLQDEPDALRNAYGGEFGQRCLLARRLVQAGVRFVEVSHNLNFINGTGWDTHFEGQQNQHILINELDIALSALLTDLEQQGILDKTLVAIGTEFGRPAEYDARGGRGHQGSCFSLVLAGGGLKHQGAYGVTDEISKTVIENPVSVPDFHATIHAALGISPAHELFDGSRPIPITDQGKPIAALFG
ncbi:DUF1501 domain-containing protein [Aureliella helgolandensis]|uniref:DUF1501 domain-containing protein n=1 Tax=Aureliella helgolandensis TaxID=2527968 RepID=A0A518GCU7_9BACT|nr:DUF1501 domain-containing protein [Aureliella helgolandensis]QDV26422.1 hypothetical protein Q31a_47960 [Aureliella helgolandensis]